MPHPIESGVEVVRPLFRSDTEGTTGNLEATHLRGVSFRTGRLRGCKSIVFPPSGTGRRKSCPVHRGPSLAHLRPFPAKGGPRYGTAVGYPGWSRSPHTDYFGDITASLTYTAHTRAIMNRDRLVLSTYVPLSLANNDFMITATEL